MEKHFRGRSVSQADDYQFLSDTDGSLDDDLLYAQSAYPHSPTSSSADLPLHLTASRRHSKSNRRHRCSCLWLASRRRLSRRILRVLVTALFLIVSAILWQGIPPRYEDLRDYERTLPQHNITFAQIQKEKYLRFPGHLWGHGLNNIMQETLVMAYLAYRVNRSYVFEEYTWSHSPLPWTLYDFSLRPSRVPFTAFLSGPIVGVPSPADANSVHSEKQEDHRAVNVEFWEKVCPPALRTLVSSAGAPTGQVEGEALIEWWVKKLQEVEGKRCVEVDSSENTLFDFALFGSPRIHSLFQGLTHSPILSAFQWSPLIYSAILRNFALLHPSELPHLVAAAAPSTYRSDLNASQPAPIMRFEGMVAVHLRRGDFKRHCPRLAGWGKLYMGINRLPGLPDRFEPWRVDAGKGANGNASTPQPGLTDLGTETWFPPNSTISKELHEYYDEHCLPTITQIVSRLDAVRDVHPGLKRVFILTNGWGGWVARLRKELKGHGWGDVLVTEDVVLDRMQEGVRMGVDMSIAQGAEVFLGNGFSSASANVVMLRLAAGLNVSTNHFL